jgi:hypothetical protein
VPVIVPEDTKVFPLPVKLIVANPVVAVAFRVPPL